MEKSQLKQPPIQHQQQKKSRKMAKIAAKMPMSAEMFEDLPQFASRLAEQMRKKVELFIDDKILRWCW